MTLLKYEPKQTDTRDRIKTLIVDNYDSYTFNLLQLFSEEQLCNVVILRNDQLPWAQVQKEILPFIDQIILSPGPGRPERPEDFGICKQILQTTTIPVFGVCLGHQGIGIAHGAKVTYGAEPVHGQLATIEHTGTSVFTGLPQGLQAVRYHSLVIQEDSLPKDLIPTAWCYSTPLIPQKGPTLVDPHDSIPSFHHHPAHFVPAGATTPALPVAAKSIMGVRHRYLPHHGVQFHPESICTQHGRAMMQNFFDITREYYHTRHRGHRHHLSGKEQKEQGDRHRFLRDLPDHIRRLSVVPTSNLPQTIPAPNNNNKKKNPSNFHLLIQALEPNHFPETEQVFEALFLTGPRSTETAWWLDSARQPHPMSRFSFMGGSRTQVGSHGGSGGGGGDSNGPSTPKLTESRQALLQYSTLHKEISIRHYGASNKAPRTAPTSSFWDWISALLNDMGTMDSTVRDPEGNEVDLATIPFDFMAGLVGYLGYEMKRESLEGYNVPPQQQCACRGHSGHGHGQEDTAQTSPLPPPPPCTCDCLRLPDATFFLATQAVVFDHQERRVYVLGIVNNCDRSSPASLTTDRLTEPIGFSSLDECQTWIDQVSTALVEMASDTTWFNSRQQRRQSSVFGGPLSTTNGHATEGDGSGHHTPFAIRQRQRRQSSASLTSPFKINFTEDEYLDAIRKSLDYIHEGESYEICMTSQFKAKIPLVPPVDGSGLPGKEEQDQAFELYKILRRLNPAPFSTFLSYPTNNTTPNHPRSGFTKEEQDAATETIDRQLILGSSPERFIRLGQKPTDELDEEAAVAAAMGVDGPKRESSRTVEMKPIKGTVAVAKGCFCSEDEGCSVDTQSEEDGSHGHDDCDDDEEGGGDKASNTSSPFKLLSERRSRKDLCEDARKREDQRRIQTLGTNVKERAENLMIVDLIRNDLAHVCASHSVRVPYLMRVESYETVHQLVTTVRGELCRGVNGAQAIKACFPPGSMTGAPKLRSVQLLDELERHQRRGVYSGCLGYIGFSAVERGKDGVIQQEEIVRTGCDMSVVIRSAVLNQSLSCKAPAEAMTSKEQGKVGMATKEQDSGKVGMITKEQDAGKVVMGELSVGAGGALTILSDPHEEWREVVLKSRSVVPSVMAYLRQRL